MGVRINSGVPQEGLTLSRQAGWFDFMVNGGGVVVLQFGRAPFRRQFKNVYVPWNEVSSILVYFLVFIYDLV